MADKNAYLRKDGRWEIRMYTDGEPGERRRYISFYGSTKEQAEQKYYAQDNKCSVRESKTEMTVRELAFDYLKRKAPLIKCSTAANYRMKIEKHILPEFGKVVCAALIPSDIYNFIDKKRAEGLSERYIADIIVLMRSMFRYAARTYNIKNITDGIVIPRKQRPEVRLLNNAEIKKLKRYIESNKSPTALGIALAMLTGIRIGELCALRWEDIDIEKRILTVRKTLQRIQTTGGEKKTALVMTAPKSASSVRVIPLPECLISMLKRHKQAPSGFVLSGTEAPVEPRTMQYRFASVLKNAELPSVHFHSLRHSFATSCIALGFDVKTLSEILGHSSVEITLNRYVHSSLERKRDCMKKITWAA